MRHKITYCSNGDRRYSIDDKDCSEAHYLEQTQSREEARLKDMLASGVPPHGVSDCTFMQGVGNGRQFEGQEHVGDYYRGVTEGMGGTATGRKYLSGLARFPGDPEAWVDSRGDVERVLTKRGWGSEGTVSVKAKPPENPVEAGPAMAPDLVTKYATEIAMRDPHPELVDMKDLKEQVVEKMAPKGKRKVSKATRG